MFSAFERKVAFRYLRARRKEGLISVIAGFSLIGILLGVATLIIVMSVMNGNRAQLAQRVLGLSGHITVSAKAGAGLPDYQALADKLRGVDGVSRVTPVIADQALVSRDTSRGSYSEGALVRGLEPDDLLSRPTIARSLVMDKPGDFSGTDAIAISASLAGTFGVGLGDELTLISPHFNRTAFGLVPRMKSYVVAAIYNTGTRDVDASTIYMPLEAAQLFYQLRGQVTGLDLFLADPDRIDAVRSRVEAAAGPDLRVSDWRETNGTIFAALQIERAVMFIILTLIIVVAAFNIISSLIMLVKDKGGDIAILRTMGATRGAIMRIFFLTGATIGIVGTVVGAAIGLAFAANVDAIRDGVQTLLGPDALAAEFAFLNQLPARIEYGQVAGVCALALGLTFLASIIPAWRAARLDPVEALRYE